MSSPFHPHAWTSVIVLAIVCTSCELERTSHPAAEPAQPVVTYRDSVVLERPHDCTEPVSECSTVDVRFPVFSSSNAKLARVLNRAVRDFFVDVIGGTAVVAASPADSTTPMPSIVDAARLLLADYSDFTEKFPHVPQTWTVHGTSKVTTVDSLVCVELYVDAYTGGAHGNTTTHYVVADTRTSKLVRIQDMVSNLATFTKVAEEAFRKHVGIGPTDDLSEHDYFIEDSTFALPENIGLTADSVILYYNTYEIAPYVMGPTRVMLPRTVIQ